MTKSLLLVLMWGAMGLLITTLFVGLITMVRGKDVSKSNRLMQMRVGIQIVALVIFSLLLWRSHG